MVVKAKWTSARKDPWDLVAEWRGRASELQRLSRTSAEARAELLDEMAGVYTECAAELASVLGNVRETK